LHFKGVSDMDTKMPDWMRIGAKRAKKAAKKGGKAVKHVAGHVVDAVEGAVDASKKALPDRLKDKLAADNKHKKPNKPTSKRKEDPTYAGIARGSLLSGGVGAAGGAGVVGLNELARSVPADAGQLGDAAHLLIGGNMGQVADNTALIRDTPLIGRFVSAELAKDPVNDLLLKLLHGIRKNRGKIIGIPAAGLAALYGGSKLIGKLDSAERRQRATPLDRLKDKMSAAEEGYLLGFNAKCAESGVDPGELLKQAWPVANVTSLARGVGSKAVKNVSSLAAAAETQLAQAAQRAAALKQEVAAFMEGSKHKPAPVAAVAGEPAMPQLAAEAYGGSGAVPTGAAIGANSRISPELMAAFQQMRADSARTPGFFARPWQLLTGGRRGALEEGRRGLVGAAQPADLLPGTGTDLRSTLQRVYGAATNRMDNEASKVLGARLGLGGAAGGAGMYAMSGPSQQEKWDYKSAPWIT
jgi:hypothetical protein